MYMGLVGKLVAINNIDGKIKYLVFSKHFFLKKSNVYSFHYIFHILLITKSLIMFCHLI